VPTEPSDVCCWGKTGRIADAPLLPLVTQSGHSLATKQRPPPSGKRDERREQVCPFPGPFLLRPLARRRRCRWHVGFRPTTLRDYVLRRQNSRPEQVAGDARAE